MVKLKNVLLVPLVIGLAAYGGVKGYLYYKVKQGLDRMTAMSAPFAALKYSGIDTSLQGVIAVSGITITPAGAPVGISIDRAELKGRGIEFLLDVAGGFKLDQPPERLHLLLSRMRVPVGSDYLASFGLVTTGKQQEMCSLGGILAQTGLEQLGFQQLVADVGMRYDYNQRAGEISLFMDYALAGLATLSLEMGVGGVPQPGALVAGAMPQMGQTTIRYQLDQGYTQRVIDTCAKQSGLDRSAFIGSLFDQDDRYYSKNLGFIPGQGIRFTLRHLLTQPGELRITLSPDGPLTPAVLSAYKPQDLVRVLGVDVSINGQPVTDLSFTLPEGGSELAALFSGASATNSPISNQDQAKRNQPVTRIKTRYIATPLKELKRYLGRDVRVLGKDRADPQQGVLVAMKDGRIDVEQRMHGGAMTLYIPLNKIERIEVLRSEEVKVSE